jgi:hypothetical protein
LINILADLKEERDVAAHITCVAEPMFKVLAEFQESLRNIRQSNPARPTRNGPTK